MDSNICSTNETTQVTLDESVTSSNHSFRLCANANNCTNDNVTLTSTNNVNNATRENYHVQTVNDIGHINYRPSNLYFNPFRLNDDNQILE